MRLSSCLKKYIFPCFYRRLVVTRYSETKRETTSATELNQYCQDKCPPLHIDPMDSIPAGKISKVCAIGEGVFTAGLILNRLRSCLHSRLRQNPLASLF